MAFGDASVGTTRRFAQRDEWGRPIGFGCMLQAERGRGIEEAVGQDADMQCAGEACEKPSSAATRLAALWQLLRSDFLGWPLAFRKTKLPDEGIQLRKFLLMPPRRQPALINADLSAKSCVHHRRLGP